MITEIGARRRRRLVDEIDATGAATPAERRAAARALVEAKVAERVEEIGTRALAHAV